MAARTAGRQRRAVVAVRSRRGRARPPREGAAARARLRDVVTPERGHPAPAALRAKWRAGGIWTDETLLDRLASVNGAQIALVDGERRITVSELRERSARVAASL